MSLHKRLRELLFEKNITPTELSNRIGISIPTIHRMVTGKTKHPNNTALNAVANFFSISVSELINDNELNLNIKKKNQFKDIPVLKFDQLGLKKQEQISKINIIVNNVSHNAFAIRMPDHSMSPFINKGSILVFDPEIKPVDRSYCLIKINNSNSYVIRQILIDINDVFIKSVNKDLGESNIKLLSKEYNSS